MNINRLICRARGHGALLRVTRREVVDGPHTVRYECTADDSGDDVACVACGDLLTLAAPPPAARVTVVHVQQAPPPPRARLLLLRLTGAAR